MIKQVLVNKEDD